LSFSTVQCNVVCRQSVAVIHQLWLVVLTNWYRYIPSIYTDELQPANKNILTAIKSWPTVILFPRHGRLPHSDRMQINKEDTGTARLMHMMHVLHCELQL